MQNIPNYQENEKLFSTLNAKSIVKCYMVALNFK